MLRLLLLLCWPKSKMLQKDPNKLFGQPNILKDIFEVFQLVEFARQLKMLSSLQQLLYAKFKKKLLTCLTVSSHGGRD